MDGQTNGWVDGGLGNGCMVAHKVCSIGEEAEIARPRSSLLGDLVSG